MKIQGVIESLRNFQNISPYPMKTASTTNDGKRKIKSIILVGKKINTQHFIAENL